MRVHLSNHVDFLVCDVKLDLYHNMLFIFISKEEQLVNEAQRVQQRLCLEHDGTSKLRSTANSPQSVWLL